MFGSKRKRGLTRSSTVMMVLFSVGFVLALGASLTSAAGSPGGVSKKEKMPVVSVAAYTAFKNARGGSSYRGRRVYVGGGRNYGK